jgi:hypothetical protein
MLWHVSVFYFARPAWTEPQGGGAEAKAKAKAKQKLSKSSSKAKAKAKADLQVLPGLPAGFGYRGVK